MKIELGVQLGVEGSVPYDGKIGLLFSLTTVVPILTKGLHTVCLDLDGQHARALKFAAVSSATRQ